MTENQHHILIVDDDEQIRRMLRRCFEGEGYRVSEAQDQDGVDEVLSSGVDLITLDLNLGRTRSKGLRSISNGQNPSNGGYPESKSSASKGRSFFGMGGSSR